MLMPHRKQSEEHVEQLQSGRTLRICEGDVFIDGVKVGRLERALKHGYHPAVALTVTNQKEVWFELDAHPLEAAIEQLQKWF